MHKLCLFHHQVCGKNISELDRLESLMATDYGAEAEKPCTGWDPVPGDVSNNLCKHCKPFHILKMPYVHLKAKFLVNANGTSQ